MKEQHAVAGHPECVGPRVSYEQLAPGPLHPSPSAAQVVDHERPDLQESATALVRQLAEYTISLKQLEDNLLARLAASQGDILEDIELIEGLEETKRTAVEIANKVVQAKVGKDQGHRLGHCCCLLPVRLLILLSAVRCAIRG